MINHLKQKVKGGGTIKLKTTTTLMPCINQNLKNRQDVFCVFVVNIFFLSSSCCFYLLSTRVLSAVYCLGALL